MLVSVSRLYWILLKVPWKVISCQLSYPVSKMFFLVFFIFQTGRKQRRKSAESSSCWMSWSFWSTNVMLWSETWMPRRKKLKKKMSTWREPWNRIKARWQRKRRSVFFNDIHFPSKNMLKEKENYIVLKYI